MTPVEDQSQIGSCSANCLAGAYEYLLKKSERKDVDVSRLFIYYNSRAKENSQNMTDSGATMTDGIEALEEYGVCLESIWPYDISRVNTRPSQDAYREAKCHTISEALQVNIDLDEMKSCLAQGFPFAFGLRLFASFDKAATTGTVPMPSFSDTARQSHGSHALLAVGYSDRSQSFIVRNSWGENWGDKGYCYIPYHYVANSQYAFDVWTVRTLANDDFGHSHWRRDDSINYNNTQCAHYDDDDDDNHAIEDHEHDEFGERGHRRDNFGDNFGQDNSQFDPFGDDKFRRDGDRGDFFNPDSFGGDKFRRDGDRGDSFNPDSFGGDGFRRDADRGDFFNPDSFGGDRFRRDVDRGDSFNPDGFGGDRFRRDDYGSDVNPGPDFGFNDDKRREPGERHHHHHGGHGQYGEERRFEDNPAYGESHHRGGHHHHGGHQQFGEERRFEDNQPYLEAQNRGGHHHGHQHHHRH